MATLTAQQKAQQNLAKQDIARKTLAKPVAPTPIISPTKPKLDLATTRATRGAANQQALAAGTARSNLGVMTGTTPTPTSLTPKSASYAAETPTVTMDQGPTSTGSTMWYDWSSKNPSGTYEQWQAETGGGKDATIIINDATGKPFTATEMDARGMLSGEFKNVDQIYFQLYGKHLQDMPTDLEKASLTEIWKKKVENQNKEQQAQMDFAKGQAELAKRIESSQLAQSQQQSDAAISATTAQFAQGRETPISQGNLLLSGQFTQDMDKRMQEQQMRFQMAENQRQETLRLLQEAQNRGDEDLAESLAEQYSRAVQNVEKAKADAAKESAAQSAAALDRLSKLSALSKDSGGNLYEGWTPQDISAATGLDLGSASIIKNIDTRMGLLDTSAIDYDLKVAQLQKAQQEAIWSGMTETQKDFSYYQNLLKIDPQAAKRFGMERGFDDSLTAKEAYDLQIKQNDQNNKFYEENGFFPPQGKYQTYVDPASKTVLFDVEEGQKAGQCGRFANDCLGVPNFFGDLLTEKVSKAKSSGGFTYAPAAGFAGLMDVGTKYGHVFMVERVNNDGSLDIVESNWNNDEKVTRSTLKTNDPKYKQIVGFVNPASIGSQSSKHPLDSQVDAFLTQVKSGRITDSDITKGRELAFKAGRLDEFMREVSSPENKQIQEQTANRYKVPLDATKREFDAIIKKREESGYGNKKFQEVVNAANKFGKAELENIQELYRMKKDLKYLGVLQQGEKGWKSLSEDEKAELQNYYGISDEFWKGVETGPIEGRVSGAMAWLGYNDPSFLAIKNITGKYTADYMKSISGAAISEAEAQRLMALLPNINQQESQFKTNLNTALRELDYKLARNARDWGFKNPDEAMQKIDQIGLGVLNDIDEEVMAETRKNIIYPVAQETEYYRDIYNNMPENENLTWDKLLQGTIQLLSTNNT